MKPKVTLKIWAVNRHEGCSKKQSYSSVYALPLDQNGKPFWPPFGKAILIGITRLLLFTAFLSICSRAQDVHVDCAAVNPCTLTPSGGLPWSGANQTWIFTPNWANTNVYVHLHNQNTTNGHTSQTVQMWQTPFGKPTAPTLTQNSDFWVQDALTQNSTGSASCNSVAANVTNSPGASGLGTCYAVGMQAGQIAIRITGANTQAGSPDNVDISITQSQANYPGGSQPGNDSSAGSGLNSNVNISQIAGNSTSGTPADATSNTAIPGVQNFGKWFNGSTWDRGRSQSQTNAGLSSSIADTVTLPGILVTTPPATWTFVDNGTAKQCSTSFAASGSGKKHVMTGCTICIGATAAQASLFANLRDGATGVGTIKWNGLVMGTAGTGMCVRFTGAILGSSNTAATCELSAATAATNTCTATIEGFDQ